MRRTAPLRNRPSSPAHAGDPVRRSFSIPLPCSGILDHPLWRMMTAGRRTGFVLHMAAAIQNTAPRSRRAFRASFALTSRLLKSEGAVLPQEGSRECRAPDAPAALRAKGESTQASHHGHAGNTRHSPRNGFNGLFRALPGDRACLPPSPVKSFSPNLTPASGRQDHTTSPSASKRLRQRAPHVHRIPPRVRDDREPPLCGTGRRGISR